jgi:hypothetical protein
MVGLQRKRKNMSEQITEKKKYWFQHESRYSNVALCAPPMRMYRVVACGGDPDDPNDVCTYYNPVMAIRSAVETMFAKRHADADYGQTAPRTKLELEESGFRFKDHLIRETFIVLDENCDLVSTENGILEIKGEVCEYCLCPWPYSEERDNAAIDKLKCALVERWKKNNTRASDAK